jgi:hypothetical protein
MIIDRARLGFADQAIHFALEDERGFVSLPPALVVLELVPPEL